MKLRSPFVPALLFGLAQAGAAMAQTGQPWLDDRRYGKGIGIRTGDLELHPGIATQLGYDSNYLQSSGDVGFLDEGAATLRLNEPIVDVARLRVTPSLSLQTLGEQRDRRGPQAAAREVAFEASAQVSYDALFVLDSDVPEEGLGNALSGKTGLLLDILPESPWGADISGSFTRTVQPNNDPGLPPAFSREIFGGGLGVRWRPGSGLLSFRLGYDAVYTLFEYRPFADYDNLIHGLQASGHWKFLPRTALLYEGRLGFVSYTNSTSTLADGTPISTKLGLSGLLSNHFALLTMLGWMATFYEPRAGSSQNYDGPIGQLQLTWYPSPQQSSLPGQPAIGLSQIAFGVMRSVDNAYLGNFVRRDRLYGDLSYFVGGVAVLALQGGLSFLSRPASVIGANPGPDDRIPSFDETRADVTGFAELRTSSTFGINLTTLYSSALNHQILRAQQEGSVAPGAAIPADNLRFDRIEVWLGARWFL